MIPLSVFDPDHPDRSKRFAHVEIEINTVCDLACFGCDRMIDVTSAPAMTVGQVEYFVEESLTLNWEWERVRLLGGEPTLHKHFEEMIAQIVRYREWHPKVFLQILTNGLGKAALYRKWLESLNISLHAEAKERTVTPSWFHNTRIVPLDRNPALDTVEPCGIFGVHGCGIGLTNHGYFLDGAGATVARVAGHDIGVMDLKDVTWDSMIEQSKILCRVCGHWNPSDGKRVTELISKTGEVTGEFWTRTLEEYKRSKPRLKTYGPKKTETIPLEVL